MELSVQNQLTNIHQKLRDCKKCPNMCGNAVHGPAVVVPVMLIGQAPGPHEEALGRPFAYTAGKTLFKWLYQATGFDESEIRQRVYFTAVARCFPGKPLKGTGDRPPSPEEIENCKVHLMAETKALKPKLILAVGKSAMGEVLKTSGFGKTSKLEDFVGRKVRTIYHGSWLRSSVYPIPVVFQDGLIQILEKQNLHRP